MSNLRDEKRTSKVFVGRSGKTEPKIVTENAHITSQTERRKSAPVYSNNGYLSRYRMQQTPRDAKGRRVPSKIPMLKPAGNGKGKLKVKVEIVSNLDSGIREVVYLESETSGPAKPRERPVCVQVAINIKRSFNLCDSSSNREAVNIVRKLLNPSAKLHDPKRSSDVKQSAKTSSDETEHRSVECKTPTLHNANISSIDYDPFASQKWLHTSFEEETSMFKDPDSFILGFMSSTPRLNKDGVPLAPVLSPIFKPESSAFNVPAMKPLSDVVSESDTRATETKT